MRNKIEQGIVALGLAVMAIIVLGLMIVFWEIAKAEPLSSAAPVVEDWRPDISHCFHEEETRELWDCIRHEPKLTSLVNEEDK